MRWKRLPLLALLLGISLDAEVRTLTILHTNDLHARLTPLENGNGGFAYVASVIRHERDGCIDCILLNAGDLVQGTPVSTIFRGMPVYEIANLFRYDAATLGNHEFDYGWAQVQQFLKTANYPIVSANLVNASGRLFTPKPYVILKVNGLRVGIIGGMTDSLLTLSGKKLLGEWHTLPVVDTTREYAKELRSQVDLVVLLAHINGPEETAFLDLPEIPVIISGHIHRGIDQAMTKDGRVLVRVKGYGEEVGRLELKVDTEKKAPVSWTWKKIPVESAKIAPAADVAKLVTKWEGEVTTAVDQPLAIATRQFDKPEVKRLIEKALCDETGSDFAWMNQGGVRDILPKGQLRLRHIWNIMPFDNRVLIGTFKGKDLPPKVAIDKILEPEREYTLAVSDFTAENQSTPENLGTTGLQFPKDAGLMRDILIDWFRKKKVIE